MTGAEPTAPGPLTCGFVVVSDRASRGVYQDEGGPALHAYLSARLTSPWTSVYRLVPDERPEIVATLRQLADEEACALILTTGGTGPALRDVTPEATEAVCDRMMPGLGEAMRRASLQFVRTALLSRQTAGLRGRTLIVNLPGRPKAIGECLDAIFDVIPHALELLGHARPQIRDPGTLPKQA